MTSPTLGSAFGLLMQLMIDNQGYSDPCCLVILEATAVETTDSQPEKLRFHPAVRCFGRTWAWFNIKIMTSEGATIHAQTIINDLQYVIEHAIQRWNIQEVL